MRGGVWGCEGGGGVWGCGVLGPHVEQVVVPGPLGFPAKNFGETKFRNTQNCRHDSKILYALLIYSPLFD